MPPKKKQDMPKSKARQLKMAEDDPRVTWPQKYTDFALQAKGGEVFRCHKVTLDKNSAYFQALLSNQWQETKDSLIQVPDYDAEIVAKFLAYLYSDKENAAMAKSYAELKGAPMEPIYKRQFDTEKLCPELLKMADFYQVQDLQDDCILHLKRNITEENAVAAWRAAGPPLNSLELKKAALIFLVRTGRQKPALDIPGMEIVYKPQNLHKNSISSLFRC